MEYAALVVAIVAAIGSVASFFVARSSALSSSKSAAAASRSADEAQRANDFNEAVERELKIARVHIMRRIMFHVEDDYLIAGIEFQNSGPASARDLNFTLELGRGGEPSRHALTSMPTPTLFKDESRIVYSQKNNNAANVHYFRGRSILEVRWKDDLSESNCWQQEGWVEGMRGQLEFFFDETGSFKKVH